MVVWQYGGEEEMRWIGKFLPFFISAAIFGVRRVVIPTRAVTAARMGMKRVSSVRWLELEEVMKYAL